MEGLGPYGAVFKQKTVFLCDGGGTGEKKKQYTNTTLQRVHTSLYIPLWCVSLFLPLLSIKDILIIFLTKNQGI